MLSEVKPETDIPTPTSVCKTSPQSQLTLKEATTPPHNQKQDNTECTPLLPNFGWESITGEKDPIPYIVRDSVSYVAWMIYEKKILIKFTPILSKMVLAFITADLEQMSETEAAMFNEINLKHCDGNLVGQNFCFKSGEPMLSLEDVKKSLNFFLTCYNVVCLTKINNDLFGFLKISGENEVAFVWNNNTQLVPLFYFEGQSEYLDSKSIDLTDKWQVRYMKFCCMAQGVREDHYNPRPIKVVDFEYVRRLFPENTPVEFSWPKDFNQDLLAPEGKLAILNGTTNTLLSVTKSSQPTNQLLTTANVTNSTQSCENNEPPRLGGGNNQSGIPRPKTHWDQTVNSAELQLNNMTLGQPIDKQSRILQPKTANSAQSDLNNTTSGICNNHQSGIKRSVAESNELTKRLRCDRKSPFKVTETSNQIASSTSIQQPQTAVLYETAGVTISLISQKENTVQNASTTQQKQSASMSVNTESCVVPHYGHQENSSSTTNVFNQKILTTATHVGHAVQPQNCPGPLYRPLNRPPAPPPPYASIFRGIPLQLPSQQMQASNVHHSLGRTGLRGYPFSNSGWNHPGHSVYSGNMMLQQNAATYNPTVVRPNNHYGNPNQPLTNALPISSALYTQITAYFQRNVLKGSPINLNVVTGRFMNSCGISGPEQARLGSWIYKAFADLCHNSGYFPQTHPPLRNIQDRTNSQAQANSDVVVVECEHVNNGGKYAIKVLPIGSLKIYGIALSTGSEKYIVNCADVEDIFQLMFQDYKTKLARINAKTLYKLNNVQKLQWDDLKNSSLSRLSRYEQYFIEYNDILLMLNSLTKNQ